jgi:putative aldouronate transport system permease protein
MGKIWSNVESKWRKEVASEKKDRYLKRVRNDLKANRTVYLLLLPVITYYIIFHYIPIYGIQIAFKNYSIGRGIINSPWAGFVHFFTFFKSYYFVRLLRNTVVISVSDIIFGFPAPIILALLINEVRSRKFKRTVQTITYLPHFISMVVLCGMIVDFTTTNGVINQILGIFGIKPTAFLMEPTWFKPIVVASGIWQQVGWGSIIYMAALSGIDQELYEAATIDGANKWKQVIHVTIPSILPTIVMLLILRCGRLMTVGHEKILLLYNPVTYETADVISTFIYRKGLLEMNYSYSTAVGLFNSVVNFIFLVSVNKISKNLSENSLW